VLAVRDAAAADDTDPDTSVFHDALLFFRGRSRMLSSLYNERGEKARALVAF